jgi:hypothetical protein
MEKNKTIIRFLFSLVFIINTNYLLAAKDKSFNISKKNLKLNNIKYLLYQINSVDFSGQNFSLKWQLPKDSFLKDYSKKKINKIALEIKNESGSRIFLNSSKKPNYLKNIEPVYQINEQGTYLQGYNFNLKYRPSENQKFWRTFAYIIGANSIGVVNYFINKEVNKVDWEYQPNREGFTKKITDGWSLDTNNFRTNSIYHIYAGVLYYQAARANDYDYYDSTLWTAFGSLFWEYIGEYREQVSTNDMIFTTMGGVFIGELFRETSFYLEHHLKQKFLAKSLAFIFDPFRFINDGINNLIDEDITVNIIFNHPTTDLIKKKLN